MLRRSYFQQSAIARHRLSIIRLHCSFKPCVVIMCISPVSPLSHNSLLLSSISLSSLSLSLYRISLYLSLALSLSHPSRGALSSIEAGLFLPSRRFSFLHRGGLLSFRFRVNALALLRCISSEARHCGKLHLWRSVLWHAVERAFPCAHVYQKSQAACGIVREHTSCSVIRTA